MSLRKFRDLLEPLRARRTWTHDAALRRVAQLRRELEEHRANESRLTSSVKAQALTAQGTWSAAPHPETRIAAVSWLAERQAACLEAQREVTAAQARLAQAIAAWERAVAALDAVDKQAKRDRVAHSRAVQAGAQVEADADWLARRNSA
jgi:hypothetical protein